MNQSAPVATPFLRAGERRILSATAIEALSWAWTKFEHRCCVLSSMQDTTVIDLAMDVSNQFPIVFLDTGYHFKETWQTLHAVQDRYGIEVEVVGPIELPKANIEPGECCDQKPLLLERALVDRDAWVSGIRRPQTSNRSAAGLIDVDRWGRTKINPIVQWSDEDAAAYSREMVVIRNPLLDQGYTSIGCEPCTSPPDSTDVIRSGRWAGTQRTECGLHIGDPVTP